MFNYTIDTKRYHTLNFHLKKVFGKKVYKAVIDAGFTCPNIDGVCGVGGCIYCSGRGSGDFAELPSLSVKEQYERVRQKLSSKWSVERTIPYFQAHSNTYAPIEKLRKLYGEALSLEGAVGLNIATRADCISEEIAAYLGELAEKTVLTVELGLQSSSDKTARLINRGHSLEDFRRGFKLLRKASPKINICVHIIFGLPEETDEMMMATVDEVARLHPEQVKIHLLHVLKNTKMAEMYARGEYIPLEKEKYVSLVADAIERLPEDTVIARLTGDGMADDLLAPDWSRKKVSVINDIDKLLFERGSWQGIKYMG